MQKQIEIIQYEKAIQTAFKEASDQFAERKATIERLQSFDKILAAKKESYEICQNKHKQGINSALDLLAAENVLLLSKQNRANVKKEYVANLIGLYKVLGGGSNVASK